jgi:hypothetical protein
VGEVGIPHCKLYKLNISNVFFNYVFSRVYWFHFDISVFNIFVAGCARPGQVTDRLEDTIIDTCGITHSNCTN